YLFLRTRLRMMATASARAASGHPSGALDPGPKRPPESRRARRNHVGNGGDHPSLLLSEDNPHGFVLVAPVGGPLAIAEEDAGLLRPCRRPSGSKQNESRRDKSERSAFKFANHKRPPADRFPLARQGTIP